MRKVYVDLSLDNHSHQPIFFGGYAGEHNETILQVKLPKRMVEAECSGYRFDFQTAEDNKVHSPLITTDKLDEDIITFKLTEQLTIAGKLMFNIVAILQDKQNISLVSKTNMVTLNIEDSPEGNHQYFDPNVHKNELQKIIAEQIKQALAEQGGTSGNVVVDSKYNPTSNNAQSGNAVAEAIQKLKQELSYEPIEILKLTATPNVAEIGSTVKTVVLNWELSKPATSLKLDNTDIDTSKSETTLTGLTLTNNKTFTLVATDEKAADSLTTQVNFYNGVYYGVSAIPSTYDSEFIKQLTKELQSSRNNVISVTAGTNEYIYYCLPYSYGECTFVSGGFIGGFELVDTISFTNDYGHTEKYRIYRSTNSNLGNTTVDIT